MLLLLSLAFAGPSRCIATWTGPAAGCAVRGEIKATAAAASEKAGERAALRQLERVAELAGAAQRARIPTYTEADFGSCAAVVRESAHVDCIPDDTLVAEALCFVELPDAECWNGQVLQLDAAGVGAVADGRKKMCDAVDARLVSQNYTDLATRRTVCAASCESKTTVKCRN